MGNGKCPFHVWGKMKGCYERHWCWFVIGGIGFVGLALAYAYGSSLGIGANGV